MGCSQNADCVSLPGVRTAAATLDIGVRLAVARLNEIEGVITRASCEGHDEPRDRRHADVAYVAFEHVLPPSFQEFLISDLGMLGRIEADAVYSRWPEHNRRFLERLCEAAERYRALRRSQSHQRTRCRLARLRSRLAAAAVGGRRVHVGLCLECRALVVGSHRCAGKSIDLLAWPASRQDDWFRAFLTEGRNRLSADVTARLSADELERRARRGDFGSSFGRRWLRYRNHAAEQDIVRSLRATIEELRAGGMDIDIAFTADDVCLSWSGL